MTAVMVDFGHDGAAFEGNALDEVHIIALDCYHIARHSLCRRETVKYDRFCIFYIHLGSKDFSVR